MKKILFGAILVASSVIAVRPSQAIGGESLGCFVNNGTPGTYNPGSCTISTARSSYTAHFKVLGGSGTYTYAWTTTSPIVTGCTSTTDYCVISAPAVAGDRDLVVSVTLSQSGLQNTVSATATIPATCGSVLC